MSEKNLGDFLEGNNPWFHLLHNGVYIGHAFVIDFSALWRNPTSQRSQRKALAWWGQVQDIHIRFSIRNFSFFEKFRTRP